MGKEFYFETDDRLDRKKYAEFLKTLLEHCDEYRREDSDGAYVIAIDSPWGTGKTRFAKMLRNFLEGREPTLVNGVVDQSVIPEPNEGRLFNVIYYNSWETDYWGDALEPLIHCILNSELFMPILADKDTDKITGNLWNATKGVLTAVGLGFARNIMGDAAVEVIKDTFDEMKKEPYDPLSAYKQSINDYNVFKDSLSAIIKAMGKKLVIIIDELDRCRPTFAIQTLELVKHLFDVNGLVFIFSLDIKQLSSSVKTVYGQEMDAPGYLCRFFDFISQIPNPKISKYLLKTILDTKHLTSISKLFRNRPQDLIELISYIGTISNEFSLSLRDIFTVLNTYQILCVTYLKSYQSIDAHKLYLALLTIKYKTPEFYLDIIYNQSRADQSYYGSTKIIAKTSHISNLSEQLNLIMSKKNIDQNEYRFDEPLSQGNSFTIKIKEVIPPDKENNHLLILYNYDRFENEYGFSDATTTGESYFGVNNSTSRILFFEDLKKWEVIKNMTLAEYYHQQLEMFNFALPSEGSES